MWMAQSNSVMRGRLSPKGQKRRDGFCSLVRHRPRKHCVEFCPACRTQIRNPLRAALVNAIALSPLRDPPA